MFKIAGSVGGMAFGLAAAGLGALTQGAVGAALGKAGESSESSSQGENSGSSRKTSNARSNQVSNATTSSQDGDTTGSTGSPSSSVVVSSSSAGSPGMATAGAEQQQRQLLAALRSLNENMSMSTMQKTVSTTNHADDRRFHVAKTAGFNMQNGLIWAGNEAGISSPYFQFPPPRLNTTSVTTTNSIIEQKGSKSYSVPHNLIEEGGSTGPVAAGQPAAPAQPQVVAGITPPPVSPPPASVPRTGNTTSVSQPVAAPAAVQAQPRRLKVNGVIPNPYTPTRSNSPFISGSAGELTD